MADQMCGTRPLVFGVAGFTCSGKTTVTDKLSSVLHGCKIFHQDDYYWAPDSDFWKNDGTDNFDDLTAIDMDKFIKDVGEAMMSNYKIIVLEGILLYEDERLSDLITHKYLLHIPFELCKSRRAVRVYIPPDPYPEYFQDVTWPLHQKQIIEFKSRTDIEFVDANINAEELFQKIFSLINGKSSQPLPTP